MRRAEEAAERSRESTWFNPRWLLRRRRHTDPDQRLAMLYEVVTQIHHMTGALVAASDGSAPQAGHAFGRSLAPVLDSVADAVAVADRGTRHGIAEALDRCRDRRGTLAAQGLLTPDGEPLDWSTQAALLLAVERACQSILAV